MLEADEGFAHLRREIERVAERGVCQSARYLEFDAQSHQKRGAKESYPSGKELVRVLNAAVQMAYLQGEFHQQDDYDGTSALYTVEGLEDGSTATYDGFSRNTTVSL